MGACCHTAGDQVVWLPAERILFTGDLAEERIFPIFPAGRRTTPISTGRTGRRPTELASWNPAIVSPVTAILAASKFSQRSGTTCSISAGAWPAERKAGKDADAIVVALAPKVRAEHPDWAAPEWIDFAIRYYATLS